MTDTGFRNHPLVPELTGARILDNLRAVQRRGGLKPSDTLAGPGINLSVEMETGTGKTYTYVKTMYELNARYGWSKFIIVVPSVAIREGVYKSSRPPRSISPGSTAGSSGSSSTPPTGSPRWSDLPPTAPSM